MIIPAIGMGPLGGSEWNVGSVSGAAGLGGSTAAAPTSGANNFSGALANAISSLDGTQASADSATQALATGQATNPTQAVTAVENASLSMDYAAQIRNQLDTAATTLFQTQV